MKSKIIAEHKRIDYDNSVPFTDVARQNFGSGWILGVSR